MSEKISHLDWERYVLGELPPDRAKALRDRLNEDPGLRREVEEIERSNRDDLERYPASRVVAKIRERFEREASGAGKAEACRRLRPPVSKRLALLIPALAAAAVLAVLLLPGRKPGVLPRVADSIRDDTVVKGTAGVDLKTTHLLVFRKRGTTVEELADGSQSRAGDILQMAYVSTRKFGMILSIDGTGRISSQFPDTAGTSAPLDVNRKTLLPHSVELDNAPRFERIFFVTSDSPIDGKAVWAAAQALARNPERAEKEALVLPDGLDQVTFLIRK
jgi:hypothetical protein